MSDPSAPPVYVLGLNHGIHDASAVLVADGALVAGAEEERFTRHKRAVDEPPIQSALFCLRHAGIKLADLHAVALGSDLDRMAAWMGLDAAERRQVLPYDDPDRLFPAEVFGSTRPPIVPVPHHESHAASSFWASGFEDAATLVVDNRGEDSSTTIGVASRRDGLTELVSFPVGDSLGLFYRIACQYAGLWSTTPEAGKLMGLASHGTPSLTVPLAVEGGRPVWVGLDDVPAVRGADVPRLRTQQLLAHLEKTCFPHAVGLSADVYAYANFAASVQAALEEAILGLAERARELTGRDRLVLAGGVALNCSANGRLARSGLFRDLYVQPASHDAGVALGAAWQVARRAAPGSFDPPSMRHAYWGEDVTPAATERALRASGLPYTKLALPDLAERVATLLAGGGIVAWAHGRAELGPRALGARSLLGDPRQRETLVRLNRIKGREMWRPLAPSVLAEDYADYFDGVPNPFMLVAATVRPERRASVPAVVHVDGSARPQLVDRHTDPAFAAVIRAFARLTGVPLVVNTSFNLAGQPLVNTPDDAIACFAAGGIDALVVGSALVEGPPAPGAAPRAAG